MKEKNKGELMINPNSKTNRTLFIYLGIIIVLGSLSLYFANAVPGGASLSNNSTDTGPTLQPQSRSDLGGRITTLIVSLEQQDAAWKAYVGNVTGSYVLQNANNKSIYEWPLGTSITGEVYLVRSASANFTSGAIGCASNAELVTEQTVFGMGATDTDNVNNTFNNTAHAAFKTGSDNILINSCRSIALWANDTQQAASSTAVFQEVTLHDGANIIYTSIINNDQRGFDNASSFDFQAIVPENRSASVGTTYYFYLELGS
jgi:hypothetical protein